MTQFRYLSNLKTSRHKQSPSVFLNSTIPFVVSCALVLLANTSRAFSQSNSSFHPAAPEFAITTPGLPVTHNWSGDSKHIAFLFWHPPIYILDIHNRRLTPTDIKALPMSNAYLSDNANFLLVPAGAEARLYSMLDNKLLAHARPPDPTCGPLSGNSVAFVRNSTDVWIGCNLSRPSANPPQTAAFRYRLPTLEISGRSTIPTKYQYFWLSGRSVDLIAGSPMLSGFTRKPRPAQDPDRSTSEYLFTCIKLDSERPCFPPITVNFSSTTNALRAISSDLRIVAISPNNDLIYLYNTASSAIARILRVPPGRYLRKLSFIQNDRVLLAGFSKWKTDDGGADIWNVAAGGRGELLPGYPLRK